MQLPKTGRLAIAALTIVAALGLAACGGDDSTDSGKSPSSTTGSTSVAPTNSNLPPTPTVAELNALFQRALDPSVSNEEKLQLVQGFEADPGLPNRFAEAYAQSGATAEVSSVTQFGDTLSADGKFTLGGQETPVTVPFVLEDGRWKLQKAWVCQMLTLVNQTSPACAA